MTAKKNQHGIADDSAQPLIEHLIELRSRILKALLGVLIVFLCLFGFANDIYEYVARPLHTILPESSSMIATDVASPFLTPFKLTLFVSLFISMPFVLFQLWQFIAPALYKNEKRIAIPLFISSVALFYVGIAFAYYVVFPLVFAFFTTAAPTNVTVMTDISQYLSFVIKLFFAFGLAFEIPVAIMLLVKAGVTTPQRLAAKRAYVVVACFVIGMLLTPPDIISQALLAIPMWLLFEAGIIFSRLLIQAPSSSTANGHD